MGDASRDDITMEEFFRSKGMNPRDVKFGRIVSAETKSPFQMTMKEFRLAAIGGRALDHADKWFVGFETHCERVAEPSGDPTLRDILLSMADIEIALVHLLRLRRAAVILQDHVEGCEGLSDAVAAFDARLPSLKHLRDTEEHFDDYILGRGRQEPSSGVARAYEQLPQGLPSVQRSERRLHLDDAVDAARDLYRDMYLVATGTEPFFLVTPLGLEEE